MASYSSAWKSGLSAVDVYWVKPEQIRFTGPSGTYLPKGGFLIEDAKHWVRNVKVGVGVGVSMLDNDVVVVGGPAKALEANSLAYTLLEPSERKVSDTAKEVKSALIRALDKDLGLKVKDIPLDDFIRALPSGGGRIILAKRRGEQRS